jgi:hypothetical protein
MDAKKEPSHQIPRGICATSTHPHQASTLNDRLHIQWLTRIRI